MAKSTYDVIKCKGGPQTLQDSLNAMLEENIEVISILPDHGIPVFGAMDSKPSGYLIVVRRTTA